LSSPSNAVLGDKEGKSTIVDDDAAPSVSVNDVSVTEGNGAAVNATFTLSLSAASGQNVSVHYATADGTGTAPADYGALPPAAITFRPGQTTKTVSVAVLGDTLDEPNETFTVNLSAPTNATVSDAQGQGTITNDDP